MRCARGSFGSKKGGQRCLPFNCWSRLPLVLLYAGHSRLPPLARAVEMDSAQKGQTDVPCRDGCGIGLEVAREMKDLSLSREKKVFL
ncbi:hypothetical protein PAHAL_1G242900 [Panicum hallii]|jgi:hypothetical protein|uniref:Uncharacterized protein n=1 Tax=Panicum hallii TaxID=206008 RepID=A0A2T8KW73_9POAL|nr:hypothetical protein PAHAL_1G242900 [Panicum hallii]